MICPYCRAENSTESLRCKRCGVAFAVIDEMETLGGASSTAPSTAPNTPVPSTAAGVMTPPPGRSGVSSSTAWPSYGGQAQSFEPGTDFGPRYRIVAQIGEGGMGTVYRAYDKDLDRVVALKLLRAELTAAPDAMKRFKQELLLASKISHKNILRIHDLGDAGGIKFISMAYVEGEDLNAILRREGRLPVERAVKIARQLCGALEAAHHEGVVHRDLKPHNVLVDKKETIYISDFGLAKSLDVGAIGMTRSGEYLGTPRYMAPEQVETKPVDQRTDLYALGLILYEMVTGDVPFSGTSTLQTMYLRVKQKPKSPKELVPELPDYIVRIILRCLETDPAQRYQSAREVLEDLNAGRAPSRGSSLQFSLPMPEKRGWLYVAGSIVLLVVVAFAIPSVRNFILRRPNNGTAAVVPALAQGKYLAVLPFRVLGNQAELGYVAEGLQEALSAKLFQLKEMRIASASAVQEASKKDSLDKIARSLGVNLIVQGTVQGAGDKLRIVVNLEDVGAGNRIWTQEFSGVTQDLLTLEDQIHSQLVGALQLQLSTDEVARSSAHPTANVEAYDLYLRGRTALRGQQEVKNIEAAIRLYEEALKKDPAFAMAYAGLSDANLLMYREKRDSLWSQRALGAAQQGQRLNDSLPEVHFSLGSVYSATGKSAEAISELKRALELAPNSDEGQRRLGAAYMAADKKDEGLRAFRRAIEVNPYYWLNHNSMGSAYLQIGDNQKALETFRRVAELEPDNATGHENIAVVYVRMGRYKEAIPPLQRALQLQPNAGTYSNLGTAFFFLKQYGDAVKMYEKAVEMNPNEEVAVGNLADAYRWSRQADKARATYDRAIALAFKGLQVNPRDAGTLGSLALYYAKKGDASQAAEYIRRARSTDRNNVALIYIEAVVQVQAGRDELALKALREAFQKGYSPEEAINDPELGKLHAQPQFEKLVKEFSGKPK